MSDPFEIIGILAVLAIMLALWNIIDATFGLYRKISKSSYQRALHVTRQYDEGSFYWVPWSWIIILLGSVTLLFLSIFY